MFTGYTHMCVGEIGIPIDIGIPETPTHADTQLLFGDKCHRKRLVGQIGVSTI